MRRLWANWQTFGSMALPNWAAFTTSRTPGVPTQDKTAFGNFEPSVGLEQVGKNLPSIYNGNHRNVPPRLGIAWDVSGKGTTVIRAGGSIIYDVLSMSTFLSQQNTNNTVTLGVNVVPTGAGIQRGGSGASTPRAGNIAACGMTLPSSQLNWTGSSEGGASVYPANLTQV